MALQKSIRGENGVTTNYHRISSLTLTTNMQNSIVVLSYTDDKARISEKENANRPYVVGITYETAYDQTMTVETAYAYLKTLPEFSGATDV